MKIQLGFIVALAVLSFSAFTTARLQCNESEAACIDEFVEELRQYFLMSYLSSMRGMTINMTHWAEEELPKRSNEIADALKKFIQDAKNFEQKLDEAMQTLPTGAKIENYMPNLAVLDKYYFDEILRFISDFVDVHDHGILLIWREIYDELLAVRPNITKKYAELEKINEVFKSAERTKSLFDKTEFIGKAGEQLGDFFSIEFAILKEGLP